MLHIKLPIAFLFNKTGCFIKTKMTFLLCHSILLSHCMSFIMTNMSLIVLPFRVSSIKVESPLLPIFILSILICLNKLATSYSSLPTMVHVYIKALARSNIIVCAISLTFLLEDDFLLTHLLYPIQLLFTQNTRCQLPHHPMQLYHLYDISLTLKSLIRLLKRHLFPSFLTTV